MASCAATNFVDRPRGHAAFRCGLGVDLRRFVGAPLTAIPLKPLKKSGGCDRDRTCDPLIKSQLLYQLSYAPVRPAKPEVAADIAIAFRPVQPQTASFSGNATILLCAP